MSFLQLYLIFFSFISIVWCFFLPFIISFLHLNIFQLKISSELPEGLPSNNYPMPKLEVMWGVYSMEININLWNVLFTHFPCRLHHICALHENDFLFNFHYGLETWIMLRNRTSPMKFSDVVLGFLIPDYGWILP